MPSDDPRERPLLTSEIRPDPDGPFPIDIPFIRAVGVHLVEFGGGRAGLRLDLDQWHMNSFAMAHGGVVMTLIDISMVMAGRAQPRDDDDPAKSLITIELKTSFMQPAVGPSLFANAVCCHRTSSLAFCESEIRDGKGNLVARGSGTFKYQKRRDR
ncbi:MAG: PaaI family thioesterase [Burkholderiaceae bacterium]